MLNVCDWWKENGQCNYFKRPFTHGCFVECDTNRCKQVDFDIVYCMNYFSPNQPEVKFGLDNLTEI